MVREYYYETNNDLYGHQSHDPHFGKKTCIIVQALKVKKGGVEEAQVPSKLCLSQHIQISDFFQQRNWEKFGKIMCKFFLVKI